MRSYPVKDNHISSAVSEILRYKKQTERQLDILLYKGYAGIYILSYFFFTVLLFKVPSYDSPTMLIFSIIGKSFIWKKN